jgi:hypothetical protein
MAWKSSGADYREKQKSFTIIDTMIPRLSRSIYNCLKKWKRKEEGKKDGNPIFIIGCYTRRSVEKDENCD